MLTAFYQERNPSKLGDIDGVLKKYVVRLNFHNVLYFSTQCNRATRSLYLRI